MLYFTGYEGYEDRLELYDLESDPQELRDLAAADPATASQMREELLEARLSADKAK